MWEATSCFQVDKMSHDYWHYKWILQKEGLTSCRSSNENCTINHHLFKCCWMWDCSDCSLRLFRLLSHLLLLWLECRWLTSWMPLQHLQQYRIFGPFLLLSLVLIKKRRLWLSMYCMAWRVLKLYSNILANYMMYLGYITCLFDSVVDQAWSLSWWWHIILCMYLMLCWWYFEYLSQYREMCYVGWTSTSCWHQCQWQHIYFGMKLKNMALPNDVEAWAMSPAQYVHQSVKNVEKYLDEDPLAH